MPGLRLVNIVKKYGKLAAVDDLSLEVKEGELLTLLGPSGCGKTTVLRSISGFVAVDSGDVFIGNRRVTDVLPEKRGIGLVFQNYALWPHMTVFQNLAFGLELKKMPKDKIKAKVEESLAMVKLEGHEDRYPRQLSGGQQQRVALARALVLEPDILLLDEPLSNLDALLREQMRFEIAQIHKQYGITTVYVTHDQTEAMVISDRIVVLDRGRMMQLGKPVDIYSRPANKFVAGFMGTTNFIHGKVADFYDDYMVVTTESGLSLYGKGSGLERGQEVDVAIRPENIDFMPASKTSSGKKNLNVFDAKVVRASYVGELIDYQLEIKDSLIRAKGDVRRRLAEGETVKIHLDPDQLAVLRG
ncbi:MAG: ABC transporter ATP-binding protein [Thermodesulfobacteriota bacterium]|jgi:spermidine/putrescine ABC transporter ATP-binding subunit